MYHGVGTYWWSETVAGFGITQSYQEIFFTIGASFASTAVSEIGDRSFFTAVLLALRYNRCIVFWGVFLALMVQSMTSSAVGELFKYITSAESGSVAALILSIVLFTGFSIRHLRESYYEWKETYYSSRTGMIGDEDITGGADFTPSLLDIEEGSQITADKKSANYNIRVPTVASRGVFSRLDTISADSLSPRKIQPLSSSSVLETRIGANGLSGALEGPDSYVSTVDQFARVETRAFRTFWTAFVLTYIAEIGDSSMIVTATLASTKNPVVVFLGAILANGVVNGFGIWAGGAISQYLNTFVINTTAGALFMFFAISSTMSLISMDGVANGKEYS